MKKTLILFTRIILGILSIILPFGILVFLADEVIRIYQYNLLKWFALLICFIGFYISGLINKKTPLKFIPLLYLSLLLFIPLSSFYYPLSIYLLLFASVGLLLTRKEFSSKIKKFSIFLTMGVFIFFLFSQPLIIRLEENIRENQYGDLINGKTIWDFSDEQEKEVQIPEYVFSDINDNPFDINSLENKTLYISFWATWCGPCRVEKPILDELKKELEKKSNVVFIDISIDHNKIKWRKFLKKTNPDGLQLISNNHSKTRALFGLSGIPAHFIVTPNMEFARIGLDGAKNILSDPSKVANYINSKNRKPANEFYLQEYRTTKYVETDSLNSIYYTTTGANRVLASNLNIVVQELKKDHKEKNVYIRIYNFPLKKEDSIIFKAQIMVSPSPDDYEKYKSSPSG
ncbi:MAG: TlpA family protein disulfide reductase [Bacteroidota bacterium]